MTEPPRKATFLVNFAARGVRDNFNAEGAVAYLRRCGLDAVLAAPRSPAQAAEAARASAARGDDILFVVGGDGSLRDAAAGIAGSTTALAAIRGGTANVWAKEVGIPRRTREAIDAHLAGRRVRMDLGRADGVPFLLMASIGFDAAVTRAVPRGLKARLGPGAYVLQGLKMLPGLRASSIAWVADGRPDRSPALALVLGNTRLYGGLVELTPDASADDGLLDLCAIQPAGIAAGFRIAARIVTRRFHHDPGAWRTRAREVCIETPGLPVQLDGDFAGETPMCFTVEPGALVVSIPAGPLPAIFGDAPER